MSTHFQPGCRTWAATISNFPTQKLSLRIAMLALLMLFISCPAQAELNKEKKVPARVYFDGPPVDGYTRPDLSSPVAAHVPELLWYPVRKSSWDAKKEQFFYQLEISPQRMCWVPADSVSSGVSTPGSDVLLGHALDGYDAPAGKKLFRLCENYQLVLQGVRFAGTEPWYKVGYAPGKYCYVEATPNHEKGQQFIGCEPMPRADSRGNYSSRSLRFWEVIDSDPTGFNGRLAREFPRDWSGEKNPWPRTDPSTWPIVRKMHKGDVLTAVWGNVGNIMRSKLPERRISPDLWLMVQNRDRNDICFVRFNSRYLRPVQGILLPAK